MRHSKPFKDAVLGRTIKKVGYEDSFPFFALDNDTVIFVQKDAEGNGPGFLIAIDKNGEELGCAG